MNETLFEEAQRIIYGDREKTYGHPAKNFEATADFWNAWLHAKYGDDEARVDRMDVAMMMVLLKIARQAHANKRDNLVDACGYLGCIQKILDFEEAANGDEAGDDVLQQREQTPAPGTLLDEVVQPVYQRPTRPLVFGRGGRSVGGIQVRRTPETFDHVGSGRPVGTPDRVAG